MAATGHGFHILWTFGRIILSPDQNLADMGALASDVQISEYKNPLSIGMQLARGRDGRTGHTMPSIVCRVFESRSFLGEKAN